MNARALGSIKFLAGPQSGLIIEVSKPITRIGRDPTNDIVVADPAVSRYLAHLLLIWGVLLMMIVLSGFLTGYFLKRKEVRSANRKIIGKQ